MCCIWYNVYEVIAYRDTIILIMGTRILGRQAWPNPNNATGSCLILAVSYCGSSGIYGIVQSLEGGIG